MAIDPADAAHRAANDAEIAAAQRELNEQMQAQYEEQKAQNEAGIYQSIGFHKFGQATENALFFMQEWQSTFNSRQEALASGDILPPSSTDMGLFVDDGSNHWDVIGDGFGNTKDDEDSGTGV